MNEQELIQVYEQLTVILRQLGLDWIVTQVTEHIRAGRVIEKKTPTYKLNQTNKRSDYPLFTSEENNTFFEKGSPAVFSDALPYSPVEQLEALIAAIEQAVVHTANMEQHIMQDFEKRFDGWTEVTFVSEENKNNTITLQRDTTIRLAKSHELKTLLEQLRKEII